MRLGYVIYQRLKVNKGKIEITLTIVFAYIAVHLFSFESSSGQVVFIPEAILANAKASNIFVATMS